MQTLEPSAGPRSPQQSPGPALCLLRACQPRRGDAGAAASARRAHLNKNEIMRRPDEAPPSPASRATSRRAFHRPLAPATQELAGTSSCSAGRGTGGRPASLLHAPPPAPNGLAEHARPLPPPPAAAPQRTHEGPGPGPPMPPLCATLRRAEPFEHRGLDVPKDITHPPEQRETLRARAPNVMRKAAAAALAGSSSRRFPSRRNEVLVAADPAPAECGRRQHRPQDAALAHNAPAIRSSGAPRAPQPPIRDDAHTRTRRGGTPPRAAGVPRRRLCRPTLPGCLPGPPRGRPRASPRPNPGSPRNGASSSLHPPHKPGTPRPVHRTQTDCGTATRTSTVRRAPTTVGARARRISRPNAHRAGPPIASLRHLPRRVEPPFHHNANGPSSKPPRRAPLAPLRWVPPRGPGAFLAPGVNIGAWSATNRSRNRAASQRRSFITANVASRNASAQCTQSSSLRLASPASRSAPARPSHTAAGEPAAKLLRRRLQRRAKHTVPNANCQEGECTPPGSKRKHTRASNQRTPKEPLQNSS